MVNNKFYKSNLLHKIGFICVFALLFLSCNKNSVGIEKVLSDSKDNRPELEKVLDFYSQSASDSLKYKAAVFLIENMNGHSSYQRLKGFEEVFDSISHYPNVKLRKTVFIKILDSLSSNKKLSDKELLPDIKYVTSKFLINTIEISFKAWNKIPTKKRASFDDFCNYILPYKTGDEPIEIDARESLAKKYSWVHDKLKKGASIKFIVDSIATEFDFITMPTFSKYYHAPLSISQVEKTRIGICDDGVNYLVNVFRALGIMSAKEMVPHWGNHHTYGHSWLYVKYGNEEYSTDVAGKVDLKTEYIGESIPKVYRMQYKSLDQYTYSPFTKDVTNVYVPTVNVTIDNIFKAPESLSVLCVFDSKKDWVPISLGKNNKHIYNNIGINTLYLAANQKTEKFSPINYPFYIDLSKRPHFFKPQKQHLDSIIITRKYPLGTARNKLRIIRVKNLNGCLFEGANNPEFKNAQVLYKISNFNSTHSKKIILSTSQKYKYVRFFSNNENYLAEMAFYDSSGKKLEGAIIKSDSLRLEEVNVVFDNEPLTFAKVNPFLGYKFNNKKRIYYIEFQARNDKNHIIIDAKYELFFWEKGWKSLGIKVAKDTVLYYKAPINSLMRLKRIDIDEIEEHVFIADKNKKQLWLGSN